MMEFVAVLFWSSVVVLGYTYVGYPALVVVLAGLRRRRERQSGDKRHSAAVIVSVYNEERYILEKIRNSLAAVGDSGQVIVVSDGSDDGTEKLAASVTDRRLTVLKNGGRCGKAYSLQNALPHVQGDIAVFTDANVFFDEGALGRLLAAFSDPQCGAACGKVDLIAMDNGEPLGEGMYMRYERVVQAGESRLSTMVGADGGMLAVRTALVPAVPAGLILDDLFIALKVVEAGYSIRYVPEATGKEPVPARVEQEFRRKVRIAAGGFQVLPRLALFTAPWRRPLQSWMFFSHKVLRWLSGLFLLAALATNIVLAVGSLPYGFLLVLQVMLWIMGIAAWLRVPLRRNLFFYPVYYFGAMNAASLAGLWQFVAGRQSGVWQRVDR